MSYTVNAKEQEISAGAEDSVLFTANRPNIVMERGEGMYLWDTAGKTYLDFSGGWAVTSLGHSPSVVQDALKQQSAALIHSSPSFYNKPMLQFAKLLTDITCFDKVFFGSSGAEANEAAIKLARKYGAAKLNGAYEIITLTNSFHGRTLATMSATGKSQWDGCMHRKYPDSAMSRSMIWTPALPLSTTTLVRSCWSWYREKAASISSIRAIFRHCVKPVTSMAFCLLQMKYRPESAEPAECLPMSITG